MITLHKFHDPSLQFFFLLLFDIGNPNSHKQDVENSNNTLKGFCDTIG